MVRRRSGENTSGWAARMAATAGAAAAFTPLPTATSTRWSIPLHAQVHRPARRKRRWRRLLRRGRRRHRPALPVGTVITDRQHRRVVADLAVARPEGADRQRAARAASATSISSHRPTARRARKPRANPGEANSASNCACSPTSACCSACQRRQEHVDPRHFRRPPEGRRLSLHDAAPRTSVSCASITKRASSSPTSPA